MHAGIVYTHGHVHTWGCEERVNRTVVSIKGVGKGGGGLGGMRPQILSSCYTVYKQLPAEGCPKFIMIEKTKKKNSFQVISSVTHTKIKA